MAEQSSQKPRAGGDQHPPAASAELSGMADLFAGWEVPPADPLPDPGVLSLDWLIPTPPSGAAQHEAPAPAREPAPAPLRAVTPLPPVAAPPVPASFMASSAPGSGVQLPTEELGLEGGPPVPIGRHAPPQHEAGRAAVPPVPPALDARGTPAVSDTVAFSPFPPVAAPPPRAPQVLRDPTRAPAASEGDSAIGASPISLRDRPQAPPVPPAGDGAVVARPAAAFVAPADVVAPVVPASPQGILPAVAPDPTAVAKASDPLDTQEDVLLLLEMRTPLGVEERKIVAETIIGRADPLRAMIPDLAFPHDTLISRRHLRIAPRHDYYVAADLNSRNGTRLNGVRLRPNVEMPLRPGDTIEIGESTFLRVLRAPNPKPPGA